MKKYIIAILIVCLICFTAIGCTGNAEGFVFGTFYSTELKSNSPTADTNNIVDGWNMLDNTFSTSIADSIVSKLNNAKAGELVAIDTNFLEVWNLAVAIHKLSDAFCPWYFPLVELWGFSPNTYTGVATSVPNATAIA